MDIIKERGNSNKILGRFLKDYQEKLNLILLI